MLSSINYIDLIIIFITAFFIWEGVHHGFFVVFVDFIAFLGSLLIALKFYKSISWFFVSVFSPSDSVSKALGFLTLAILTEFVLGFVLGRLTLFLPKNIHKNFWSKMLSVLPAIGEALVITAFISTLFLAFPVSPVIKDDLVHSLIAGEVVRKTQGLGGMTNEVFGGVIEETITYLTIEPGSDKQIVLNIKVGELKVDESSENEMFRLINEERKKSGFKELVLESDAVPVARSRAKDMWERKYFGHVTPEGKNAGDFLDEAKVDYGIVGENIALAPSVSIAHTGLMNSKGHRENILNTDFSGVGIGVVDNGVYGKMFVQIFIR